MAQSLTQLNLCFIGAGSMAEAIIRGLIEKKQSSPERIFVLNRQNQVRLEELHNSYGVQIPTSEHMKDQFIQQADIIVLAVKPKDAQATLAASRHLLKPTQVLISVIAGLKIQSIESILGAASFPIVRTMPNTSSTIGLGATGISYSNKVSAKQQKLALDIFQSTGIVAEVKEEQLDIVTGLSGSGPAYIYYVIEAMIQGAVEGGLSEDMAAELTLQTVLGAVSMVKTTQENPTVLRQKVTSPGGTTQAAIEVLEQSNVSHSIRQAILRASERAGELGHSFFINQQKSE